MSRPHAYLRKSSVRDPEKDTSPETQEREVRALAERHGDVIDKDAMLADWDVSGRAEYTKKREGYAALIHAIESGEASVVYSYSLSRLGRSTSELARLFDLCASKKVPLRLVADAVDTSTASGRMMANMLASVAQFEAEVSGERLSAMYTMKRAKAIERGEDPVEAVRSVRRYGEVKTYTDKDGNKRTVGKDEDPEKVLAIFREEGSYGLTAKRLNDLGIKSRDGKRWWPSSVAVVIERLDPEYKVPRQPGVSRKPSEFALAKLLICPFDGAVLTGQHVPATLKDGTTKVWTRYACKRAETGTHADKNGKYRVSIAEHLIMPAIEEEAALYRDPDEAEEIDIAARRQSLSDRRSRIIELRVDGNITREEASERVAEIDAEMAALSDVKPRDLRLVGSWSPSEVNTVLRQLWSGVHLDRKTFEPVTFDWRHPEWRRP